MSECTYCQVKTQSAHSPDLNPIECIWSILKSKIDRISIKGKEVLIEAILISWNEIEDDIVRKTITSITKRHAKKVFDAQGDWP